MGQRLNKINQMLKEEIGRIIQRELDDPQFGFITVTKVITSADLHLAKVYVSVMESDKEESNLIALSGAASYIKKLLVKQVKLRCMPELKFFKDDALSEAMRLEKLFKKIEKKESAGEEDES